MDKAKIILRPFKQQMDRNFVLATWLNGQRFGNNYFSEIPAEIYFREYAAIIMRTLALPGLEVVVACDQDKPDWIVGFAVMKDDILHWIYVRGGDYREKGIAKLMLGGRAIKTVKAFTRIGRAIAAKHGLIFNPF